ncbi:DsrE family protein [Marinoscillum sp.]|uniref:DsrE family protein n=1 Tax=Marinoscillum sp. TaxID=2024838 RepID=UPI003BAA64EA
MRTVILFLLLFYSTLGFGQELEYPVIKGFGGVVRVPNTINPAHGAKVIIDVTSADVTDAGVNKSLDRVARLINLYGLAEVQVSDLEIVVIIHGGATRSVITHEGYQEKYGTANPDIALIKALKDQGVEVLVCSQALIKRGFKTEWLNPDVRLALSAITTLVDYQQKGFSTLIY